MHSFIPPDRQTLETYQIGALTHLANVSTLMWGAFILINIYKLYHTIQFFFSFILNCGAAAENCVSGFHHWAVGWLISVFRLRLTAESHALRWAAVPGGVTGWYLSMEFWALSTKINARTLDFLWTVFMDFMCISFINWTLITMYHILDLVFTLIVWHLALCCIFCTYHCDIMYIFFTQ